jgi:hypothetical protein
MRRTTIAGRDRRTVRFASGSTLVMLAMALSAFGVAPAVAQDVGGDEGGEDGEGVESLDQPDDGQPLEITGSALYVAPVTDTLPPTVTQSVPPAAVCVLQPDLCPDSLDPVRSGVTGAIAQAQGEGRDFPVQPVPEGNAAVSFLAGVPRYQTAILFDTPAVPDGEDVMRYELTFAQSQPTYDASSPAFRRAVLGLFEAISAKDPVVFGEGLAAALQETPIDTSKVLALEACPLLEPFDPAGAPQASDEREMPRQEVDGEEVAAVDCTFGGNGVYDEAADLWRVDLAFTAQAWADGEIENHGVLLRPIGAPNLAFGDADTTTNAQLVLDITEVTASMETAEAFEPGDFESFDDAPLAAEEDLAAEDGFAADDGSFDADAPGFGDDGGDDLGDPMDSSEFDGAGDGAFDADAPDVADGLEGPGEPGEPEVAVDAQATRPAGSEPITPWWVWMVAPLLLGGAYLTGSAVLAPASVTAGGGGGGGALTRMLEKHPTSSSGPTRI